MRSRQLKTRRELVLTQSILSSLMLQEGFAAYRWLIWPLVLIHVVALVSWMLFLCRVSSKEEERLKAKHKK